MLAKNFPMHHKKGFFTLKHNERIYYVSLPFVFLEVLKMLELIAYFAIKGNRTPLIISFLALVACFLFLKNSPRRVILISFVALTNFYLIYFAKVENQHFALLTSMASLISFGYLGETLRVKVALTYLIKLMRIQVAIVYIYAALWKLNSDWLTGTQIVSAFYDWALLPSSENPFPMLYQTLSVLVICVELLLGINLLVRNPLSGHLYLLGLFFHLSLVVLAGEGLRNSVQLAIFGLLCVYTYSLDHQTETFDKVTVFWDASCSVCKKFVSFARKLDVGSTLLFVPNSDIPKELERYSFLTLSQHTIIVYFSSKPESYKTKFEAMLFICSQNPFFAPLRFLEYFPLAKKIGNAAYSRFASRRGCKLQ